jgi:hypothetical protein
MLFNIEGYGEFFSGITPVAYLSQLAMHLFKPYSKYCLYEFI